MSLDQFLLDILVCPETKTPVKQLSSEAVSKLNAAIREGKIRTRGGKVVSETVDTGLLRADGKILYPVRGDIPILLVEEGFEVGSIAL